MQQPSRRTFLAGTGAVIAVGTAGCIGGDDSTDEPTSTEQDPLPTGLTRAFEYVYSEPDDGTLLRIGRVGADSEMVHSSTPRRISALGEPEWMVGQLESTSVTDPEGIVATGSFDVDTSDDEYSPDGNNGEFDTYVVEGESDEERRLATDGETALLGTPEWVRSTLKRHDTDDASYLETASGVRALLRVVDFTGMVSLVDDDEEIRKPFEQGDVDVDHFPDRLVTHFARTEESTRYTLAGWYAEMPAEPSADSLASFMSTQLSIDDVSTEVREDEHVMIARASRPYTPTEERPEVVGAPRYHGYDEEEDVLLLRFDRGDSLPVDRYELEIDGEVYEGDWARGQAEIGEGSIIHVDATSVEPGDDLTIRYEGPEGGYTSSQGTTLLRGLPFQVDFDPEARTATLRYVEGPPLDADRIDVVVHRRREDEASATDAWSGELTSGDTATLTDLPIEGYVTVEYEPSDGESVTIGGASFGPPGRFSFEYDGRADTLTIKRPNFSAGPEERRRQSGGELPEQEPVPADQFEITLDSDPAGSQWSDASSVIQPGDQLTLENVSVGTEVAVAWVGEGGHHRVVADTRVSPDVEFTYSYDQSTDELTVTHAGEQPVDAGKLALRLHTTDQRTVDWEGSGSVTEGDEHVLEDVPEQAYVVVTYEGDHLHARSVLDEGKAG